MDTQLPMFINPHEIIQHTVNGEWGSVDKVTSEIQWDDKLRSARWGGNHDADLVDIKDWKVFLPITLMMKGDHIMMGNGHHRVAMSDHMEMPLIPVLWDDQTWFAGYPSESGEGIEYRNEMNYESYAHDHY